MSYTMECIFIPKQNVCFWLSLCGFPVPFYTFVTIERMSMIDRKQIFRCYDRKVKPYARHALNVLRACTYVFAFLFLLSGVYRYGFMISEVEGEWLHRLCDITWILFLLYTAEGYVFHTTVTTHRATFWTYLLHGMLLLTLLPVVFYRPAEDTGIAWIWEFFNHEVYRNSVLGLLSLTLFVQRGVALLGRRTNPALILAGSFFVIILIGAGLLMLPRSTHDGIHWLDAFFLSTSATCVAGMSPMDISTALTLEGQIVLICLVQIGGLGVMTITSFFALMFMKNSSLYSNMVMGDVLNTKSLNSLLSTLVYIMGFTFFIEGTGMLLIWWSVSGTLGMTVEEELFFSAFHAVSAFCNAGFSSLPNGLGNTLVYGGHNSLFVILSFLIILGGVGFPVLVNFRTSMYYYFNRVVWFLFRRSQPFRIKRHLYNLNTQIVLKMTAILLVLGTLSIAILEWNGAFAEMPIADKCVHSFFNAVSTRSAGFSATGITRFAMPTMLIMFFMMMIGGGSQSTAGGVRVNVFAVNLLNLRTALRGGERVVVSGRELTDDTVKRANAALLFFVTIILLGAFFLTLTEEKASFGRLMAESVAAVSTAGVSMDFTAQLSPMVKGIVIVLMFVGRVGAFTLVAGFVKQERRKKYKYPSENIIIC